MEKSSTWIVTVRFVVAKDIRTKLLKVVLHRSHGYVFGVKVKTVKLIGERRFCMPAQIIQRMAFTQIMDIWRPGRSLEDHLKGYLPKNILAFMYSRYH